MAEEPTNANAAPEESGLAWLRGLLLPLYFLVLLICGFGLVVRGEASHPGPLLAIYGVVLVLSIAALFLRRRLFGFTVDRRSYMSGARSRRIWFGR
jgi:hypothetical protein